MTSVAIAQLEIVDGDWLANVDNATRVFATASSADLYVLPELWTSGYAYACWRELAEQKTEPTLVWMRDMAIARDATVVGSTIAFNSARQLVNRLWCVSPAETTYYDKAHLFPPLREPELLAAGRSRKRVTVAGMTFGLSLCFDLRFPTMYRRDARDGAQAFLVSSEWPASRADALRALCRARAIENQAFLVLCNRTGTASDGLIFDGQSMVVSPKGEIILDLHGEPGVATVTLDSTLVEALRKELPVLSLDLEQVD